MTPSDVAPPSAWNRLKQGLPLNFFQNLSWQYAGSLWSLVVNLACGLLVARTLGPGDYGLMALGLSLSGLVFSIVELRLHEATIRFIVEFRETSDLPRLLATVKLSLLADATTGGLAFCLLVAVAPWVERRFIHDPRGVTVIILCGLSLLFANVASATATGLLRVFERHKLQAILRAVGTTFYAMIVLAILTCTPYGVFGVLIGSAVTSLATNLALVGSALLVLNRHVPFASTSAPLSLVRPRMREMGRFVLNTYLLSLTSIPSRDLDLTSLSWFAPIETIGIYKIAKSLMSLIWQVAEPVFFVIYPELAKLRVRGDFAATRAFLRRLTLLSGVAGTILVTAAFLLAPSIVRLLLGARFDGAATIFRWMVWCALVWAPLQWLTPALMAAGRPDLVLRAGVFGAVTTFTLYLLLIPRLGGVGAALGYGLGVAATVGAKVVLARRADLIGQERATKETPC